VGKWEYAEVQPFVLAIPEVTFLGESQIDFGLKLHILLKNVA
jgi:hypothetical protein